FLCCEHAKTLSIQVVITGLRGCITAATGGRCTGRQFSRRGCDPITTVALTSPGILLRSGVSHIFPNGKLAKTLFEQHFAVLAAGAYMSAGEPGRTERPDLPAITAAFPHSLARN